MGLCCPLEAGVGLVEFLVKEHTDAILFQRHMHRQLHTTPHAETPEPFKQ